ncbi:subtilisin-like protein [Colletotrichum eremochloae]|nr:subtilisin-like protein [Colletotrichum eremochloae]
MKPNASHYLLLSLSLLSFSAIATNLDGKSSHVGVHILRRGIPIATTASSSANGDDPEEPLTSTDSSEDDTADDPRPDKTTDPATATSTSSVPTEIPVPCLIFPKDEATMEEKEDFISLLNKELGNGNYRETRDTVTLFVSADITSTQRTIISRDPLIGGIEPDVHTYSDSEQSVLAENSKRHGDVPEKWWMKSQDKLRKIRKRAMVEQENAPTELVMLSQPPRVGLSTLKSYTYDDSAGAGVTVYVLDKGYNTQNSEYAGMAVKPRWIFAGSQADDPVMDDLAHDGHGSCVASKINGPKYGVAKKASLVIVKAGPNVGDTLDGLSLILQDIRKNKVQGQAVVSFSRSLANLRRYQKTMMRSYIEEITKEDVVFITAAGNDNRAAVSVPTSVDVYRWPALLAEDGVPIINVGAVDNTGKNFSLSKRGPLVHVMAPGVQVHCAANSDTFETQRMSGTSLAASAVAGLAAYLLALGKHPELYQAGRVAENMKKVLMDSAYERVPGGGRVAYNGHGSGVIPLPPDALPPLVSR